MSSESLQDPSESSEGLMISDPFTRLGKGVMMETEQAANALAMECMT
jgi:hypothetical protein